MSFVADFFPDDILRVTQAFVTPRYLATGALYLALRWNAPFTVEQASHVHF
jgi:hypothetical protein